MKADIEKLLKEIGNDRHGLSDLIMHFGNPEEIEMEGWWNAPIEVLQDNLRKNVQQEDKEELIRLAMGVGAIEHNESKISEY
ncbi:MAG: hypothetical protein LBH22_02115 [Bacteroidales bacterium]|jgi:hypothetical protein|nr:hypothetical protein [Bacteroidales bacterium]